MKKRVDQQLDFLIEADKLKTVSRANVVMDGSRHENTAEHSWHLALWAMVFARAELDLAQVIGMVLLHDLVEIDAGDHPIHLDPDQDAVAAIEQKAADRLFALLPAPQGNALRALWEEFEAGTTPTARFARLMDHAQPMFEELANPTPSPADRDILQSILETGRFARLKNDWPAIYDHAEALFFATGVRPTETLDRQLRFLAEADQLKAVLRATTIFDGSRRENSAEHSWHICLFALVLAEHAIVPIDLGRVLKMLVLHDIVEIDAGDAPIHGDHDVAAQEAKEQAAATRIFGLLPPPQARDFRALWDEFEAAESNDAIFAKSIDRVQPVLANLATGGGTWTEYNVTLERLEARVGHKVQRGAPAVWDALLPRITDWFSASS